MTDQAFEALSPHPLKRIFTVCTATQMIVTQSELVNLLAKTEFHPGEVTVKSLNLKHPDKLLARLWTWSRTWKTRFHFLAYSLLAPTRSSKLPASSAGSSQGRKCSRYRGLTSQLTEITPLKHLNRAKEATKLGHWVNRSLTWSTNLRATTTLGCQAAIASSQITTAVLNPYSETVRSLAKFNHLAITLVLLGLTRALLITSDALEEICLHSKAPEWCTVS